jgi:hypothetical protein
MGTLTLTLEDITVTLDKFVGSDRPRQLPQIGEVSINDGGSVIINGATFEGKHIWVPSAFVTSAQRINLSAIWARSDYLRRTTGTGYQILIYDQTEEFQESTAQTRDKVPTTSVTAVGIHSVSYFAQFYGILKERPKFTWQPAIDTVSFKLFEGDKIPKP